MRKCTALILAILMSVTLLPCVAFADMQFADLPQEHWAYANVQTLVNEGTIKGYEDGTFRPSGTVTRAEFVKMIGKGSVRYLTDFADVAPNHWAYDYVMYSGLVQQGTTIFQPDQAIKRIEVIELLWKRAGSKTGFSAPGIITNQTSKSKDAVAWAYSCGIVNGDDGIHLRLDDTMSRAEGATLILRSREKSAAGATASFVNAVKASILEQAFASLDLFDDATYTPNKAVTFGELARAAVRIAGSEYNPSYFTLSSITPFEHKYARDLDVLGRNVIGTDKVTAEMIDKQATVGDVIASITFGALHRSGTPYAVNATTEAFSGMADAKNRLLTFAFKYGVQLDVQNSMESLNRPATLKDVIATAVLVDSVVGLQTDYSTDTGIAGNKKFNHSLDLSGRYYEGYQLVLKDLPNAVYNTPFTAYGNSAVVPKNAYRFAQSYHSVFSSSLALYKSMLQKKGLDCNMVYYPSLTADNGNGYTMRVKITVNSLGGTADIGSYFICGDKVDKTYQLLAGKTFYADIASGAPLSAINMDVEKMFIDQIVCE